MSANRTECFVIVCNGCGEDMPNGEFTEHWPNLADVRKHYGECYEWWSDGADIDLCEDCKSWTHPQHRSEDDPEDYCDRCGYFIDLGDEGDHPADAPVIRPAKPIVGQMPLDDAGVTS